MLFHSWPGPGIRLYFLATVGLDLDVNLHHQSLPFGTETVTAPYSPSSRNDMSWSRHIFTIIRSIIHPSSSHNLGSLTYFRGNQGGRRFVRHNGRDVTFVKMADNDEGIYISHNFNNTLYPLQPIIGS